MARSTVRAAVGPGRSLVTVRLPKGRRSLDSGLVRAIDEMKARQRVSNSNKCTIIFFKKGRVAAQRCEGRRLKAHNARQCRSKAKGRTHKRFVKCR